MPRKPSVRYWIHDDRPPRTFFDVMDEISAEFPGVVLMNPHDVRVRPATVERFRDFARIGIEDDSQPEFRDRLAAKLLDRRWVWGFYDRLGFIAIIDQDPITGEERIALKEVEEGIPVGRPTEALGAPRKAPLEKARTDAFFDLLSRSTGRKRADIGKAFRQERMGTYALFLEAVERRGRELMKAMNSELDPSNGLASFEIMTNILSIDAAELVERLARERVRNLNHISYRVLDDAMIKLEQEGKHPLSTVRPMTRQAYQAILLDLWPESPAAIADFWLDDQKHYEALYYPIREAEITVEQLDAVLGDYEAITRLVNASPSNPHKDIVFGWKASMNAILEG